MALVLLITAFAGLGIGYLAALALFRARVELARAQARAEAEQRLGGELQSARKELGERSADVAALKAHLEGLQRTATARLEAVQEAQGRLSETFAALSAQALKANSEAFLQLAGAQMQGGREQAVTDLQARQEAITNLLSPVRTTLEAMQTQVQALALQRSHADATLTENLRHLAEAQQGLQGETSKLTNALRRPEVRGQWGEIQLRNVVEYAGMQEHVDFELQNSMEVGDARRRPDMLVHLPGGKRLAVDAKAPVQACLEALELEGAAREERLDAVAEQIRTQVRGLGDKRYFDGLAESPDFVVLFLPLEALFSLALERDRHLLEDALKENVILASPTTLVALLKAAAYGWAQERITANAEEIQKLGTELLERVMVMAEHTDALRKALVASVEAFNRFAGSLESRVLATGAKLRELGIRPAPRRKGRALDLRAPQAIHLEVSGLPKLGVAGEAPVLDVEAVEEGTEPED
ncbi:MAG: DNA recombination protein RmuC [Holophaga sp.]|jgi:DNA recombination protein RmuC